MPIGEGSIPLDTKYGYIHRTLNKYNEQVITPRYCKFQRTQLYKHGTGWSIAWKSTTSEFIDERLQMSKEKKKEAGAGAPQAPGASVIQAKDEAYLLNRPGEPEFKMTMTPLKVIFICTPEKKPVWSDVRVTNSTKDKQSYKVKCTSADIFRVQPPLGFIKPGETATIRMWFQNKEIPEGHRHYFAIYHVKCSEGKTVKEIWTKTVKPDGVKRIAAVFEKPPPSDKK